MVVFTKSFYRSSRFFTYVLMPDQDRTTKVCAQIPAAENFCCVGRSLTVSVKCKSVVNHLLHLTGKALQTLFVLRHFLTFAILRHLR